MSLCRVIRHRHHSCNKRKYINCVPNFLDMLSAVKSTEASLVQQNSVERSEFSEQIAVVKTENVPKAASIGFSDSEARCEPDRRWNSMEKQSNKSSISSSREQLQAELQAKKQELEELMYKDQGILCLF